MMAWLQKVAIWGLLVGGCLLVWIELYRELARIYGQ